MRIKLVVVGGEVKVTEVSVGLPVVIGRGKEATLQLPHKLVSRAHCRIFEQDGQTMVEDLGSLNGTFVNNSRISVPTQVPFGQLLTIGDVTFRLIADAAGSVANAAAPAFSDDGESEATVHAGNDRPSAFTPDFTTSDDDDDFVEAIEAAEIVEEDTEEAGAGGAARKDDSTKPATPQAGIPNLPKFAPRRRR